MAAPDAVILLSGGLDSTTLLALARADGKHCVALTFRYGQRHAHELDAARRVAARTEGVTVADGAGAPGRDALVVRAPVPALDDLVPRLVRAGIAVRELAPVVSPLEAAFLALTDTEHEQPEA